MSKLSPALKQLINAAHSRPGPVPAPPRIQAVYQRIQEEATERKLGRPSWLGISTAATMTMNSPESMIALYNSTSASRPENESVQIAEFMREIGLKCIGFNGIPRTINMLNAFRASLPPPSPPPSTPPHPLPLPAKHPRHKHPRPRPLGRHLPPARNQAHRQTRRRSPGPARLHHQPRIRRLVHRPAGKAGRKGRQGHDELGCDHLFESAAGGGAQVLSHVFGLRKGWEDGTWKEEPEAGSEEAIRWLVSDEGCTWVLEKVDELVEALGGGAGSTFAPVKSKL
ncbi:hypothetical protein JI435_307990 [Parastagonospora nodorum SN15]|uniref:Uncharacterized protein n=1 Tax=Phaeosphaeria nodorum (strain SN15 / ATCC MYA-4574 / FGSC 10173) TaxID=321614 RepID=A0A7U2F1H5_PHANO|nr:hypothetical protein JI435_307990 [Parastagonospora nodorum SN15]